MSYKLSEIVTKLGDSFFGEDKLISAIAPIDLAKAGDLTFIVADKYKKQLVNSKASAVIIAKKNADLDIPEHMSKIVTDNPYLYLSKVSQLFYPAKKLQEEIKSTVVLGENSLIEAGSTVLDYVVIGNNTQIGKNCQIYPHVVIGDNVVIGEGSVIYPNVTIYDNVQIGSNCELHSGVIIGSDGFGYAPDTNKQYNKIAQVGGVIIGNKVSIGANTTIDCGTLSPTIIEDGVIIDNLVQIAHNVKIGAHSAIAACVGIAGSTVIGKYCTLAGGAMIADHIDICDHTIIGGFTGIGKSIVKPDLYMAAYPFSNYKDYAKNAVHVRGLNDMYQKLKNLEKQIDLLTGRKNVNE